MSGKLSVRTESFEGWRFSNYRFQAARLVNASVERKGEKYFWSFSDCENLGSKKSTSSSSKMDWTRLHGRRMNYFFLKWKVDVNSTLPSQGNLFIRVHKNPSFSLIQLIKKNLHFQNANPHKVMKTANCKSMINELSLIWRNFPLTTQLFNEMTHLILSLLFIIHIFHRWPNEVKFSQCLPLKYPFFLPR